MDKTGTFEPDNEGKDGDEHDGLDVENHVDRIGEFKVRFLHDQLGEGPSDSREKTRHSKNNNKNSPVRTVTSIEKEMMKKTHCKGGKLCLSRGNK